VVPLSIWVGPPGRGWALPVYSKKNMGK